MSLRHVRLILILFFILPIQLFAQNQTVFFQNGLNNYNSTFDTFIDSANPDSSFSESTDLTWDSNPDELTTFIRFENIFVSEGGSIPNSAYIVSATLNYYVTNSGDPAIVSEVLSSWDNSLTWNLFDFENDIGLYIGIAECENTSSYKSIDLTSSLSAWAANPSLNRGWIFQFTGSNGCDIYSSERTTINQRPSLTIIYSENHPPNQPLPVSPQDNSTGITLSPQMILYVSDPESDNLQVKYFARSVSSSVNFTLIGVPDTQYYTDNSSFNQYFYDQTNWIVANKDALNIVFISQLGDCVENGDTFDNEWQVVNNAWSTVENPVTTGLNDGMPYRLNVGNHDQSPSGGGSSASTLKFNEYFGISRFNGRLYYGGHYGIDNDNHYELFTAAGMDFLVLNLEYDIAPVQDVLDWADALLKTYSNRRTILVSHYLIEPDDRVNPNAFSIQGQIIYDNLKNNSNLFLMLCGHKSGEGRRLDNFNGNSIHTLVSDYQSYSNGGNGFLRIMEFRPSENKIYVSTYSPSLDQFEFDNNSNFVLDYDMGSGSFSEIANINNNISGSNVSFTWSSLSPGTQYEWYVEISDGNNTSTGPIWSFATEMEDISLPVFISSFSASRADNEIYLEWRVEAELENAGFIIEKSHEFENGTYAEIASYLFLDDLKGRGNASDVKIYHFVDNDIAEDETYYYRLADVSTQGELTHHETIRINPKSDMPETNLNQNYPNPFNSITTFRFYLPKTTFVELNVYDLQGRVVQILVKDDKNAGQHNILFDASHLASGIYYYELRTGDFKSVKKFILIK